MNIKSIFVLPILISLGMGLARTIVGSMQYMTGDPGSLFLMLVMAIMLVAIALKLRSVIFSLFE